MAEPITGLAPVFGPALYDNWKSEVGRRGGRKYLNLGARAEFTAWFLGKPVTHPCFRGLVYEHLTGCAKPRTIFLNWM